MASSADNDTSRALAGPPPTTVKFVVPRPVASAEMEREILLGETGDGRVLRRTPEQPRHEREGLFGPAGRQGSWHHRQTAAAVFKAEQRFSLALGVHIRHDLERRPGLHEGHLEEHGARVHANELRRGHCGCGQHHREGDQREGGRTHRGYVEGGAIKKTVGGDWFGHVGTSRERGELTAHSAHTRDGRALYSRTVQYPLTD